MRVRDPFAARDSRDARRARATRRELKTIGLHPAFELGTQDRPQRLPRIVVHSPRPSRIHAVEKSDVEDLLIRLGERFFYGLRAVELAPAPDSWTLGRLVAPGTICIFDVERSPWSFPSLDDRTVERLVRADAVIEHDERGALVVSWPRETLRRFVLFDVLLHEIGHHVFQHHNGKRAERVARTRDHEAAAELIAQRARRLLGQGS